MQILGTLSSLIVNTKEIYYKKSLPRTNYSASCPHEKRNRMKVWKSAQKKKRTSASRLLAYRLLASALLLLQQIQIAYTLDTCFLPSQVYYSKYNPFATKNVTVQFKRNISQFNDSQLLLRQTVYHIWHKTVFPFKTPQLPTEIP